METRRQMVMGLCLVVGSVIFLASACEEDTEHEVPERVWDAAVARCESCGSTTTVEECADFWTKYFPWDDYTDGCIEAWIAEHECVAAKCSGEMPSCEFASQVTAYNCWRSTANCGVMCGDPNSSEWQGCYWLIHGEPAGGVSPYDGRLCSEQTPDYCRCGEEQCVAGEYCCVSETCEDS